MICRDYASSLPYRITNTGRMIRHKALSILIQVLYWDHKIKSQDRTCTGNTARRPAPPCHINGASAHSIDTRAALTCTYASCHAALVALALGVLRMPCSVRAHDHCKPGTCQDAAAHAVVNGCRAPPENTCTHLLLRMPKELCIQGGNPAN